MRLYPHIWTEVGSSVAKGSTLTLYGSVKNSYQTTKPSLDGGTKITVKILTS